jgi:hypothetical protein
VLAHDLERLGDTARPWERQPAAPGRRDGDSDNSFWNAGALHPDDSVAIFSKVELCRTTSLVSAAI